MAYLLPGETKVNDTLTTVSSTVAKWALLVAVCVTCYLFGYYIGYIDAEKVDKTPIVYEEYL